MANTGQKDALVKVVGVPEAWATLTGGAVTVAQTKNWNGGSPKPGITQGRPEVADITVDRPWDPHRDIPVLRALIKGAKAGKVYTVIRQYTDSNGTAIDKPQTFSGCRISSVAGSEYNTTEAGSGRLTVTLSVEEVT